LEGLRSAAGVDALEPPDLGIRDPIDTHTINGGDSSGGSSRLIRTGRFGIGGGAAAAVIRDGAGVRRRALGQGGPARSSVVEAPATG
jgi:hypothetical protein